MQGDAKITQPRGLEVRSRLVSGGSSDFLGVSRVLSESWLWTGESAHHLI